LSRAQVLVGAAVLLSASLRAQDGPVVRGLVLDAATGRPISGAVIAVLEALPPRLASTSAAGAFAIRAGRAHAWGVPK